LSHSLKENAVIALGVILLLIGDIWILVRAFKTGFLWGLGSLFIPLVGLVFVLLNLRDTWKPLLLEIVGTVIIVVNYTPPPHS